MSNIECKQLSNECSYEDEHKRNSGMNRFEKTNGASEREKYNCEIKDKIDNS